MGSAAARRAGQWCVVSPIWRRACQLRYMLLQFVALGLPRAPQLRSRQSKQRSHSAAAAAAAAARSWRADARTLAQTREREQRPHDSTEQLPIYTTPCCVSSAQIRLSRGLRQPKGLQGRAQTGGETKTLQQHAHLAATPLLAPRPSHAPTHRRANAGVLRRDLEVLLPGAAIGGSLLRRRHRELGLLLLLLLLGHTLCSGLASPRPALA